MTFEASAIPDTDSAAETPAAALSRRDIARRLSRKAHATDPTGTYSLAQHAFLVSFRVPPELARDALLFHLPDIAPDLDVWLPFRRDPRLLEAQAEVLACDRTRPLGRGSALWEIGHWTPEMAEISFLERLEEVCR